MQEELFDGYDRNLQNKLFIGEGNEMEELSEEIIHYPSDVLSSKSSISEFEGKRLSYSEDEFHYLKNIIENNTLFTPNELKLIKRKDYSFYRTYQLVFSCY